MNVNKMHNYVSFSCKGRFLNCYLNGIYGIEDHIFGQQMHANNDELTQSKRGYEKCRVLSDENE